MSPSRPSHMPRVSQDLAASLAKQEELCKRIADSGTMKGAEESQSYDVWREELQKSNANQLLSVSNMVGGMGGWITQLVLAGEGGWGWWMWRSSWCKRGAKIVRHKGGFEFFLCVEFKSRLSLTKDFPHGVNGNR